VSAPPYDPWLLVEFKREALEEELRTRSHPELREFFLAFGLVCYEREWHPPFITCLGRTEEENRAVGGVSDSRHLYDSAGDLRVWVYPADTVLPRVLVWMRAEFEKRGGQKAWGLLVHNAGSGSHIHVERRDPSWKATYLKRS
jgi:hypothetical protein